jgi:formate dehydrogenase maturation protein FdhE
MCAQVMSPLKQYGEPQIAEVPSRYAVACHPAAITIAFAAPGKVAIKIAIECTVRRREMKASCPTCRGVPAASSVAGSPDNRVGSRQRACNRPDCQSLHPVEETGSGGLTKEGNSLPI